MMNTYLNSHLILTILCSVYRKFICVVFPLFLAACYNDNSKIDIPATHSESPEQTEAYLLDNENTSSVEWVTQLLISWKSQNWKHASENVETLILTHKENIIVCLLGAEYFLSIDALEKAIELSDYAEKNGADQSDFYKIQAQLAVRQKKYGVAIDHINEAILINVKDPEMYTQKGLVYLAFGDTLSAITYLKKAFGLNPLKNEVGFKIARLYFESDKLDESEKWLTERSNIDAMNNDYQFLLAEVYQGKGMEIKAMAIFRKMLVNNNLEAGTRLLSHFEKTRQMDSIFYYANMMLDIDSLNILALNHKAMFFDYKGYYPSALQYFSKTLAVDSLNEEALLGIDKVEGKIAYLRKLKKQHEAIPRIEFSVPKKKKVLINE